MATEAEVAWAAGLFEGEGYMGAIDKSAVRLTINMTDEDVLQTFAQVVDCGKVTPTKRHKSFQPHWKPQWSWALWEGNEVRRVLTLFIPHFHERRRLKAEEMLERLDGNRGSPASRTHCPKGHPLSGANLVLRRNGKRRCATCDRESMLRAQRKRRVITQSDALF